MSPNEKKMISLKINSIHDSRKQIKIPWKIKWELKVFLNTGQSFRWARGYAMHFGRKWVSEHAPLTGRSLKKKNQFPTAASLITTNLYPRYHCDTTALPEGLEVAKLLVEHPGLVQSTIVSFLEATIGKEKRKVRKKREKEKCILFSYPQTVKLNDRLIISPRPHNYISWRRKLTP